MSASTAAVRYAGVVLDPFDPEFGRAHDVGLRELHAGAGQRITQALDRRLGLDAQRIVGVHAEDEMHAALQVQAKLDLLVEADRRTRPPGR